MRTIKSEFPDYDNVKYFIPPFTCEPWHNDMCPRYVWRGDTDDLVECELTLWVDYLDPAKRENDGATMFYFTVGTTDDGRPNGEFWGETEDELRSMLNGWYEKRVGYRPDDDMAQSTLGPMPLGQLLHLVGTRLYLGETEL